MTIPLERKAISIERTILETKEAILKRLRKRGWNIREGIPRPKALPDDGPQAVSVWVFPVRTNSDSEGQSTNWHSEIFATNWLISIITADTSKDPYETSSDSIVQATGSILEALTTTNEDVSMDGAINWTDQYDAKYGIMDAGGDRTVLVCSLSLRAHHPFFPTRVPPGLR